MSFITYSTSHLIRQCHKLRITRRFYADVAEKRGLVLGAYTEKDQNVVQLTEDAQKFNEKTDGKLIQQLNLGAPLKAGKARVFWDLHKEWPAVALVGLGSKTAGYNELEEIEEGKENIRIAAAGGCRALRDAGMTSLTLEAMGDAARVAEAAALSLYTYQDNKSEKKKKKTPSVQLLSDNKDSKKAWESGLVVGGAQNLARRLMETPANLMTPTIFAETAAKELEALGVKVTARDQKWAESMKMFSFLSVARGSDQPPVFLEMHYNNAPNKNDKPCVLVGKGVTFDSGGVSIKPSANMAAMRGDMGGAACVVATMKAVAALKLPVNIIGLTPLTENMVNGSATKPGDVFIAMNGKSVLVDNTDAEGRLILADALCYSKTLNPLWVVDLATLTGAMQVALGTCVAGAFTHSPALWSAAHKAGASTGDRLWRMPLWREYTRRMTDFPNVDVHNVGKGKGGGACTAAAFLAEFAPTPQDNIPWMHLDIAGVMSETEDQPYLDKGMAGRPTRTLVELVRNKDLKN